MEEKAQHIQICEHFDEIFSLKIDRRWALFQSMNQ